jgi:hypothetical protein
VALAFVPACPNDAGRYVFFAVHGGQLEALGHELVGRQDPRYVDASPIDGFADNVRGFAYFAPMSCKGWYFFTHRLIDCGPITIAAHA